MLITPNFENVMSWLDELNIAYYQCENCQALHIPHIQMLNDVYDAKVDLVDDVVYYTIIAEIKPSAILTLIAELSQINAASPLVKVYLDIQDDNYPKLMISHALSCGEGISLSQFALFLLQIEEEALQVISELKNCDFVVNNSTSDSVTNTYINSKIYH